MSTIYDTLSELKMTLPKLRDMQNSVHTLSTRKGLIEFINSSTGLASESVNQGLSRVNGNVVYLYENVSDTRIRQFILSELGSQIEAIEDAISRLEREITELN